MSQAIEGQRAIIEGAIDRTPGRIYEVRARIVPAVPANATVLRFERADLYLRGYWHSKGYQGFGLAPIPIGAENTFSPELQPEPEDDPNLLGRIRPRTIISDDGKVFMNKYWGPGDPDIELYKQYRERVLYGVTSFDFEAEWARLDTRNR